MTGTKWALAGLIVILDALDLSITFNIHDPAGKAASIGQVFGWAIFIVMTVPVVVMLVRAARAALQQRRYRKTYARLASQDAARQLNT
jgi:uncharacterized membrane protein